MTSTASYESTGRVNQKARTRAAMVEATRALLAEGASATVEQAAARAAVSRTTAYRYFPNQRALLIAAYPELDQPSLLGPDAPADPHARLEVVTEAVGRQLVEHEAELRAMLRLSLELPAPDADALPLRRGRVVVWVEDALAPLAGELTRRELRRLALAIRATLGIESLVWLTDVGGLSRPDAVALMRASARALLRDATGQP